MLKPDDQVRVYFDRQAAEMLLRVLDTMPFVANGWADRAWRNLGGALEADALARHAAAEARDG